MTAFNELDFKRKLRENNQQTFFENGCWLWKSIAAAWGPGVQKDQSKRTDSDVLFWHHDFSRVGGKKEILLESL